MKNDTSHERLLRIYILGCLKLLRSGSINRDQLHWLVFNPAFQREVAAIGFVDLANIISEGLFIEDVLSLCGELEYEKLLNRIELMTLNGLASFKDYDDAHAVNKIIRSSIAGFDGNASKNL